MLTLALPFPAIDPVLIEIGPFAIRWYALAYIAGLVLGWRYVRRLVQRPGWRLTPTDIDDLLTLHHSRRRPRRPARLRAVLPAGLLLSNPLEALAVWQGGMSFHGGAARRRRGALRCSRQRRGAPLLEIGDAVCAAARSASSSGGSPTSSTASSGGASSDVPWAVVFPRGGPAPRHPSQLYEAGLEGLVLFAS